MDVTAGLCFISSVLMLQADAPNTLTQQPAANPVTYGPLASLSGVTPAPGAGGVLTVSHCVYGRGNTFTTT